MRRGSGGCWLFVRNGGEAELEIRKVESGLRSKKGKGSNKTSYMCKRNWIKT